MTGLTEHWELVASVRELLDAPMQRILYRTKHKRGVMIFLKNQAHGGKISARDLVCMDMLCYHHGGPLSDGDLEDLCTDSLAHSGEHGVQLPEKDCMIKCPWHNYIISSTSGDCVYRGVDTDTMKTVLRTKGIKQRVHPILLTSSNDSDSDNSISKDFIYIADSSTIPLDDTHLQGNELYSLVKHIRELPSVASDEYAYYPFNNGAPCVTIEYDSSINPNTFRSSSGKRGVVKSGQEGQFHGPGSLRRPLNAPGSFPLGSNKYFPSGREPVLGEHVANAEPGVSGNPSETGQRSIFSRLWGAPKPSSSFHMPLHSSFPKRQ